MSENCRPMLTEAQRALLLVDLAPLDGIAPGLAAGGVAYVCGGDDESVLTRLETTPGAGRVLGLTVASNVFGVLRSRTARFAMFVELGDPEPATLLRLGRVYAAASRSGERNLIYPQLPDWLEIVLGECLQLPPMHPRAAEIQLSAETVEEALRLAGEPPALMARAAFQSNARLSGIHVAASRRFAQDVGAIALLARLKRFNACLARYPEAVTEALAETAAVPLINALTHLGRSEIELDPWRERLVELALGDQKSVRELAETLLLRSPDAACPLVVRACERGGKNVRLNAVRLLPRLSAERAAAWLATAARNETNPEVREAMRPLPGTALEMPPLDTAVIADRPLPGEACEALRVLLEELHFQATVQKARPRGTAFVNPPDDALVAAFIAKLESPGPMPLIAMRWLDPAMQKAVQRFVERPDVALPHAVRLLVALDLLLPKYVYVDSFHLLIDHFRRAHAAGFGLREIEALATACGIAPGIYLRRVLPRWDDDAIWPYFLERLDEFTPLLTQKPGILERAATGPFEILQKFPTTPPALIPQLFDIALGPAKTDRPQAQKCLDNLPDLDSRLMDALRSSRQEVRANAADWLGRRGAQAARPLLAAALKKEKSESVRQAVMLALERLEAPLDEFVDRERLLAEARKGMARGAAFSWLAFDALPDVRWKTGEAVPRELVAWFIVQAVQQKSPEPGALLRYCFAAFDKNDRSRLATMLLQAWIAHDTVPANTADEAAAKAAKQATAMAQWAPQKSYDQHYRSALDFFSSECRGSATAEKGVLAVVGACGDAAVVDLVHRYLERWYGYRAAQCKAMVSMLGWIDQPPAIHLLLRVAGRFRTRGIQQEAEKAVEALAERKGWTVDELADRTVPTAGLDDGGGCDLDYGPRKFRAVLTDALELRLEDAQGAVVSALPEPRACDDAELAAAARKHWAALRKDVKALLKSQTERLYEAMGLQRGWRVDDWRVFLLGHPILAGLCRRLVWTAAGTSFRPTEAGFVDWRDDDVTLPADAMVRLAWIGALDDASLAGWRRHMLEYRLVQPFDQLGGEAWRLPEDMRNATAIEEFEGHLIEAFKLRGSALSLGYLRGSTEDGGRYYEFRRKFGNFETVVAFSGNQLPEENRMVALERLTFCREGETAMPLRDVPPVLLSIGWNHMRTLAAAGTGFDPDWARKVEQ